MSRIGKQILDIPNNVQVSCVDGVLLVKGPKGELSRTIRDEIKMEITDKTVEVKPVANNRLAQSLWGTYASHAKNMMHGVTEGYTKDLEVHGVGYRSEITGKQLILRVGFSHPVVIDIPEGLEVTAKDNKIKVTGFDKELVGKFTAEVRQTKKPEPYKGKGIRYAGEVIRRKQGKKSST